MHLVIDVRDAITDFAGATRAMTNLDYDMVEIVVTLTDIMLRRYDPMAVNSYVFSYQMYGQTINQPNNDGMILSTAISVLANVLQTHLSAMLVYTSDGQSLFQLDRFVRELLVLKPRLLVSPNLEVSVHHEPNKRIDYL